MKNIYYLILVDAIESTKKNKPGENWKLSTFIFITFINSLNVATIFLWLRFLNLYEFKPLELNFFGGTRTNNFIEYCLQFCLPIGVLNYFFIFYNNRYEDLLNKYSGEKNKIAMKYMLGSLAIFMISIILSIWLI